MIFNHAVWLTWLQVLEQVFHTIPAFFIHLVTIQHRVLRFSLSPSSFGWTCMLQVKLICPNKVITCTLFPWASNHLCICAFTYFKKQLLCKESACNAGDPGSIPALGRHAGERIGYQLQYSWAFLYPLQYSWAYFVTQLVNHLPEMRETWVRSPEWEDLSWRRERLPTLAFWPGEFHELCSPWGHKE